MPIALRGLAGSATTSRPTSCRIISLAASRSVASGLTVKLEWRIKFE